MKKNRSVMLTESAIMVAFSTVLSMVKVVDLPYGGSVTAASMLPVILIAYRYGTAWGLFTGFTASLLQLLLGMNSLSWATSFGAAVAIILLDYVVAFTAMGLGGVFRRLFARQEAALAAGSLLVCVLRYVCHVISGCTVWIGLSIPDADSLIYSLGYNAVYMVPETIITIAAAVCVGKMLDFRKETITQIPDPQGGSRDGLVGALFLVAAGLFDSFLLFRSTQVENAEGDVVFDITGLAGADWLLIAVLTLGALLLFFLPQRMRKWTVPGVAAAYALAHMAQVLIAGGTYQTVTVVSVAAVAAVVTLLLCKQWKLAVMEAVVLLDGVYLFGVCMGGSLPEWKDWVLLLVAIVCGTGAYLALDYYQKKLSRRNETARAGTVETK